MSAAAAMVERPATLNDIRTVDVRGRTVLVRADLNVPMVNGVVTDAMRVKRFAPTVADLVRRGASVVVMSHLGRPAGVANPTLSLAPVADILAAELGQRVIFVPECVGAVAEQVTRTLPAGSVALLENLRYHREEEDDDRSFALMLSVHGDLYVNDALSVAHRAHASTHAIAGMLPSFAGPMLMAEHAAVTAALHAPERPLTALVGGGRVTTKIGMLRNIANKVDRLIVTGAMANTFLAAVGIKVGRSLYEPEAIIVARRVLDQAQRNGCDVLLPVDLVVAEDMRADAARKVVDVRAVPPDMMALDVGPETIRRIVAALEASRTLIWNGPLGAFEIPPFAEGTFAIARAVAELTGRGRLTSVAGGGDTAAALALAGLAQRVTTLSTAGGAFLQTLEGRALPGLSALMTAQKILEEN